MRTRSFWPLLLGGVALFAGTTFPLEGGTGAVISGNEFDEDAFPLVALTFDDGPHSTLTPKLLDILSREKVDATFYVIGRLVQQYPLIVQRMTEEGHEIGNHTWTHPDLRKISDKKIIDEMAKTSKVIKQVTGHLPYSMRAPYGGINDRVFRQIPKEDRPVVMWTVDPRDWKKPGVQTVVSRVVEGCKPGAIILLHDIHQETIEAVPQIIQRLRAKGYKFVKVSQILATKSTIDLK